MHCTPRSLGGHQIGPIVEHIAKNGIEPAPGLCPFETRHLFTEHPLTNATQFRVVTYNLLADLYCDSDYTRKHLFPYCPPYALDIDYRKQLFVKELLGYHADLMCLQEVDAKIFDYDLQPLFIGGAGGRFGGSFQRKGTTAEGLATFYNRQRFQLIERYGCTLGENIPKLAVFADIWQAIDRNRQLAERICERSTAVQVTVLRAVETENVVIVANTHLYFHPDADHIRLLQIGLAMRYVEDVHRKTAAELSIDVARISIIFCGDFNSVPECGIYKLMTEQRVPPDFIDFQSSKFRIVS